MSLCLGKRISELRASEFNLELSGGVGEPLVVGAETAGLCLSVLPPPSEHVPSQYLFTHFKHFLLNLKLKK